MNTYVFHHSTTGLVKIGRSDDVEARRTTIERHIPRGSVALVACWDGDYEAALHNRFQLYRTDRGEWFENTGELREFVNRVRGLFQESELVLAKDRTNPAWCRLQDELERVLNA